MISDISVDADCCWCLPEEGAGGGHDDPVGEVAAALLRDQHRVRQRAGRPHGRQRGGEVGGDLVPLQTELLPWLHDNSAHSLGLLQLCDMLVHT